MIVKLQNIAQLRKFWQCSLSLLAKSELRCGQLQLRWRIASSYTAKTLHRKWISCITTVTTNHFSLIYIYRVGQIKWHRFTFLLVTNECINKILWFLAQINYINQQIAWCQFYVNEWVTRYGAPRVTSRVRLIQAVNFQGKSYGDLDQ